MKGVSKLSLAVSIFAVGLVVPATSSAWDGTTIGTISTIQVTRGDNFGFRVSLAGSPSMCSVASGNSDSHAREAYLAENDSNYKVYVAMLMMAKASGMKVTIYTTSETFTYTDAGGVVRPFTMCHIGHIGVD